MPESRGLGDVYKRQPHNGVPGKKRKEEWSKIVKNLKQSWLLVLGKMTKTPKSEEGMPPNETQQDSVWMVGKDAFLQNDRQLFNT